MSLTIYSKTITKAKLLGKMLGRSLFLWYKVAEFFVELGLLYYYRDVLRTFEDFKISECNI